MKTVLVCLLALLAGATPALALDDCNAIKKLENRLRCLQNNIIALTQTLQNTQAAIQTGEPVLLRSLPGGDGCIANGQRTVYIKKCEGAGPEAQWVIDPVSK